ncbi:MAG: glycosyltransferase [Pelagimonas sp.]|uniref:glycosyltransferase n=1 Tax=Pelagimonas sp. TaxID=2073170 RepID=UPI003D6BC275
MRALYYNWVDYLDDEGRGGGVSVYQRNLMQALGQCPETELTFFSSGVSYDLVSRAPRWERVRHGPDQDRDRRYEIVNSGVLAPAHHSYGDPAQLSHPATEEVVYDLIDATGPYDVLHLNNLEGLPVSVLEGVKARWPEMRIVLSLHNYYPFCSQVNFWHQERMSCVDFDDGRNCVHCLPERHETRNLQLAAGLSYRLKAAGLRPGSWVFDVLLFWSLRFGAHGARMLRRLRGVPRRVRLSAIGSNPGELQALLPPDGSPFLARRAQMVATINTFCDVVLCVSDAVRRLAVGHGIDPTLAQTSYIGTREAERFEKTSPRAIPKAPPQGSEPELTLGYLGYMRRDKGFYFLLQALETLPAPLARRVRVVIAARRGDKTTMGRVAALGKHLAEVDYANGYGHDDLDQLLDQVDVGLIPVLWHDNLPQVALEMHARHIPLLCADMGGAQELGNCPEMVFPAGDIAAFHARIEALLEGAVDFDSYWQGARPPVNMAEHREALLQYYKA